MCGYLLPESTIIQKLFPQILQSLVYLNNVLFPREILVLVPNEELPFELLDESVNPLTILDYLNDYFSAELHLVNDLNRSNLEVVFLLILILDGGVLYFGLILNQNTLLLIFVKEGLF